MLRKKFRPFQLCVFSRRSAKRGLFTATLVARTRSHARATQVPAAVVCSQSRACGGGWALLVLSKLGCDEPPVGDLVQVVLSTLGTRPATGGPAERVPAAPEGGCEGPPALNLYRDDHTRIDRAASLGIEFFGERREKLNPYQSSEFRRDCFSYVLWSV